MWAMAILIFKTRTITKIKYIDQQFTIGMRFFFKDFLVHVYIVQWHIYLKNFAFDVVLATVYLHKKLVLIMVMISTC